MKSDLQREFTKESVSCILQQKQAEIVDSCFCVNKLTAFRIVPLIVGCENNLSVVKLILVLMIYTSTFPLLLFQCVYFIFN